MVSIHNPRIKYVRRLANHRFREKEKKFLVEGTRFVEEILDSDWPVEMLVCSRKFLENPRAKNIITTAAARNAAFIEVADDLFAGLADTSTPQGIIAVAAQRGYSLEDLEIINDQPALLVLVDGVQDPGNLGAIVRSADAAGAGGVILLKGTADVYNPKTLRATMGSIFHLPIIQGAAADEVISYLTRQGIKIAAGDPRAGSVLFEVDLKVPCALAVGGEAAGVGAVLKENVDVLARIPMPGRAESLNVAISVSIMLYEVLRQRDVR
ncbi:MAG: RNA methyltransferase [Desulfotomaculaceae bacterium]|nr:RNA methyltransferase [Desulfotomaculaceae bacterium]MDD4766505.1 RNA methyltransferase [Desulfotomaculaceae bacterium]